MPLPGLKSWRSGELALLICSAIFQGLTASHGQRRTTPLGVISVGIMIAQLVLEGPRWQLALLYAATASTAAVSVHLGSASRLIVCVLSIACTLVTVIVNALFPWFQLPTPTGPYRIGRVTHDLQDPSRRAWVAIGEDKGETRRVLVDVWYPAVDGAKGLRSRYIEKEVAKTLAESFIGRGFSWLASHVPMVRTFSVVGAAPREGRFPVVLFSHGLASTRIQNTAMMEDLASHGFICAACDHTWDAAVVRFPDGDIATFDTKTAAKLPYAELRDFRRSQIEVRAADLTFLLDQLSAWGESADHPLSGRVDCSRASAIGHSQGGATVAAAAQLDKRIQAAVLLDAWMWPLAGKYIDGGVPCPILLWESQEFLGDKDLFLAFNSELSSKLAAESAAAWKLVTDRAGHMEYADMALVSPRFLKAVGIIKLGPRDMEGFQDFQSRMVLDFIRTHVGGHHSLTTGGAAEQRGAGNAAGAGPSGRGGGSAALWRPPSELQSHKWGTHLSAEEVSEHAATESWTPKQRAAVKSVLLQKIKRGEYTARGESKADEQKREKLCGVIKLLVHHRSLQSIRELVVETEEKLLSPSSSGPKKKSSAAAGR